MSNIWENEASLKKAIALFYDQVSAPKVVARGAGDVAEQIIDLARKHEIHLHEDPVLLKQLEHLEVGDEIPLELYRVIAEIIAFVYWLKAQDT